MSAYSEFKWEAAGTAGVAVSLVENGAEAINAWGIKLDEKSSLKLAKLLSSQDGKGNDKKLRGLEAVNLGMTEITWDNPILSYLKWNNTLTYLNLAKNEIGDKGATLISSFLRRNRTLEELVLYNNSIGNSGAKALAKSLKGNDTLGLLNLQRNYIGNKAALCFLSMLKSNTSLYCLTLNYNNIWRVNIINKISSILQRNRIRKGMQDDFEREAFRNAVNGGRLAPWNRAKLMVIGQGHVGKSATVKSLLGEPFEPTWVSTVGVSLSQTETELKTTIWKKVNIYRKTEFTTKMAARIAAQDISRENMRKEKRTQKSSRKWYKLNDANAVTSPTVSPSAEPHSTYSRGSDLSILSDSDAIGDETTGPGQWYDLIRRRSSSANLTTRNSDHHDITATAAVPSILENSNLPPVMDETEIARIRSYAKYIRAANESRNALSYTIWDFGGQQVFYTLHPLFLTNYGVYLLVFDIRKLVGSDESMHASLNELKYWLNSVSLYAPDAPILLVGTFKNSVTGRQDLMYRVNFNLQVLLAYYPQYIKNQEEGLVFFPVDNRSGDGIKLLSRNIEHVTRTQEYVNRKVSLRWLRCLDFIMEENSVSWLPYSRVLALGRASGIENVEEINAMLRFFHELGVVVHFNDTPALNAVVTTHPQWLISQICKVVRDSKLHRYHIQSLVPDSLKPDVQALFDHALVSRDLLENLWDKEQVDFMLDIMRNVLLLSDWSFSNEEMYLIPTLLSDTKQDVIMFQGFKGVFDFTEMFLPIGMFQRLVCLCVTYSGTCTNSKQPMLYTKDGIVSFGENGRIHFYEVSDCIHFVIENTLYAQIPQILQLLLAMIRKLGTCIKNLPWKLKLDVDGEYISYEKIKRKKNEPWFQEKQTTIAANPVIDTTAYFQRQHAHKVP